MSDYTIFMCDSCRISVPIATANLAMWEQKHAHEDGEDDES